ncbi:hypothetical protein D3C87_245630 [compost metagenome]
MMSINNLLAYLIGWGELVFKWNRKKDNNEPVYFPDTGYKWNELYETTWYEKWTMGRMIQFNTASPYNNARGRIRKWKKQKE